MISAAKNRFVATLVLAFGLALLATPPALASEGINTFTVTASSTAAGAHPDLTTSFTLDSPGAPEAARNVSFNAPEGLFGNPKVVTQCTASDFGQDQCPSDSQVGLVTIYADSGLLGTAPLFSMVPGEDQTALFAFIVPTLNIPINIPVAVRTGGNYGLRFTVSEITQATPLAGAELTFWGFPAEAVHNSHRFAKGSPGNPAGCPGSTDTSCIGSPTTSSLPESPLTDNPTICTGSPLSATLTVQTYQDPAHPTVEEANYPATTDCDKEVFRPVLFANSTTNETDSASGLNVELSALQFLTHASYPSEIRSAIVTLPEGFMTTPRSGPSRCTRLPSLAPSKARCTSANRNQATSTGCS